MLTISISMFIFALVGAISPGPVNIIATSSGAIFGFIKTLSFVSGATISYTFVVFLVGMGLNSLLLTYPQLMDVLRYLGGGFLLYMSWKIATAIPTRKTESLTKEVPTFLKGVMAQGLNPKAWLVSMTGVSLFVSSQTPAILYLAIFCTISFFVCFIGVSSWAALGQVISHYLSNDRQQLIFNRIMGILLSTTVLSIFTDH